MVAGKESERTKDAADVRQPNRLERVLTKENSMKIFETADYYVVSFFPDAEEVEIDDKTEEKGYKAIMGLQDGHHVVMKVMYDKSLYPLNAEDRDARGFSLDTKTVLDDYAPNIGDCAICKRLDANIAQVTEIRRLNQAPVAAVQMVPAVPVIQAPVKSALFDTGNPLQDMMTQMLYTTKLNQTGQVATALALEDPVLLEAAMPKTIDGVLGLIGDLTELSQGKGDIYRTPEEVTKYVAALRAGVKQPTAETVAEKKAVPVFRRASTVIIS